MIFYALSVALILTGCFVFYKILLQRETFFPLNRFILLGCLALSFSLPFIPVPEQFSFRKAEVQLGPISWLNNTPSPAAVEPAKVADNEGAAQTQILQPSADHDSIFKKISALEVILWIYWIGVIVFGINFLVQLFILLYRVYSRPFIQDGKFRIVEIAGDQAPCSFANNIFINPEKYDWDTYTQIILHEKIHIQQGHSYDIIFAELALILQWFNPFAWLYRKAMEDNLEFLTDNELLQHSDIEPTSYQMSLVRVSAPNFPASLTTNYNQSILKRRLLMMNAKKSNINSTWKYLCIVPLLLLFVSLINEPVAYGKAANQSAKKTNESKTIANKGNWFATIKGDKIKIRFEDSDNENNNNSNNDFPMAEFSTLPRDKKGAFSLTRDAGTIAFIGKFDDNAGMGTYEFKADNTFASFLAQEGIDVNKDKDLMIYYLVNLNRGFVKMLKGQGYTSLSKNDLIPLAALNVTGAYIASLKNAGLETLALKDIIPLKALNVDAAYIADIKKSGYQNLTAQRLITLKAQNIDGDFIKNARNANQDSNVQSALPVSNKTNHKTNHKVNGKDDDDDDSAFGMMIAKKVLNISAEYAKSFSGTNIKVDDEILMAFKALGITAEYVKSFETLGLNLSGEDFTGMKALSITAEDYKAYEKLGFKKLDMGDVVGAKATGTTPTFIAAMKKKGYNYSSLEKYIAMKTTAAGTD